MPVSRPLQVLLLLQRPEAWGNVASIWQTMSASPMFEPEIWLLPYNVSSPKLSATKIGIHRQLLTAQGIPFTVWHDQLTLKLGDFDVAIFTHPYDRERPQSLWFSQVARLVSTTVYIPYGLSVGAGRKNLQLQFSQPIQAGADIIIARSEYEKAMYLRHCPKKSNHIYITGHPRFDRLIKESHTAGKGLFETKIAGRVAFLWNAHFSFGHRHSQSSNFSTFDLLGPEILEYFAARQKELCLIWRPHPGLFPALIEEEVLETEDLPLLKKELSQLGIILDESTDHLPAFACSDALLTDPGSFLIEYLALQRPMLPLVNPEGESLNYEASEITEKFPSANTMGQVIDFIESVAAGDQTTEIIRHAQTEHLPLLDGRSGERVCQIILSHFDIPYSASRDEAVSFDLPSNKSRFITGIPSRQVEIPPVVSKLNRSLRKVRAQKAKESSLRKWMRRKFNAFRTGLGEKIKHHPFLMLAAERLPHTLKR